MRQIVVNEEFPASISTIWHLFTNVADYPKYVKFVLSVKTVKEMKLGGMWYDISTILWLPLRYNHWVTKYSPEKEIEYTVYPLTGGKIVQSFVFQETENGTKITGGVTMDLKWSVLDTFIGKLVESRMRQMVEGTITNVRHFLHT